MFRFLLPALLIAAPAAAQSFQDTSAIDRAVATFTARAIGEDGGALSAVDGRLKLASCPMVAMSWHGVRHDAVEVTCTGPAWHLFVPVRTVAAPVGAIAPAALPAAPPPKAEIVIKRGDPITIAAEEPGFSISREGVAMSDAAAGGRFLVRADGTKAPIQAIAIESGRATLPGWTK